MYALNVLNTQKTTNILNDKFPSIFFSTDREFKVTIPFNFLVFVGVCKECQMKFYWVYILMCFTNVG